MTRAAFTLIAIVLSTPALSGEGRLSAGASVGTGMLEDDAGNELTADLQTVGVGVSYYFDEAGPFVSLSLSQLSADNFELNDAPLNAPDEEADARAITVGYRAGTYGDVQFFVGVGLARTDPDDGESDNTTGIFAGVERTFDSYRLRAAGGFEQGDDVQAFTFAASGTAFVTDVLGLFLEVGYVLGTVDVPGDELDTTNASIGGGIELRFLQP